MTPVRERLPKRPASDRPKVHKGDRSLMAKGFDRAARPMLSAMFVSGGIDAALRPEGKVKRAEVVVAPLARRVPVIPDDVTTAVRLNGIVQVAAGVMLASGRARRLAAALALIASVIPTTYAGHRFWEETDDAVRAQQRIHFLKNVGLLGGLIFAATDAGERGPSHRSYAPPRWRSFVPVLPIRRVTGS